MYYHLKQFIRDFLRQLSFYHHKAHIDEGQREKKKKKTQSCKMRHLHNFSSIAVCIIEEYTIEATVEQRLI